MILSIPIAKNVITCVKNAPEQLQIASNVQKIELNYPLACVCLAIQMIFKTLFVKNALNIAKHVQKLQQIVSYFPFNIHNMIAKIIQFKQLH